ncbi:MAG: two-component system response regulator [Oscillospiraceae bacterium]
MEALALINRYASELSVVLLDIIMPEMDGFEVLAAMNRNGWVESIPVIIISAENSSSYIEHAYSLGAVEYINRPFDANTVQRRVKNIAMLYSKHRTLENMVTSQILEREKSTLTMVAILGHIVEFRNGESGLHVLHIRLSPNTFENPCKEVYPIHPPSRITRYTNACPA